MAVMEAEIRDRITNPDNQLLDPRLCSVDDRSPKPRTNAGFDRAFAIRSAKKALMETKMSIIETVVCGGDWSLSRMFQHKF
ncbi:hypothetical protein Scep_007323 [Stephania cephalantha]|uniref:Uncharacterized protein n=1 Tax=Stephania cephalantha TaxID=152367 RepID=A0AAP0K9M0_9MAGN